MHLIIRLFHSLPHSRDLQVISFGLTYYGVPLLTDTTLELSYGRRFVMTMYDDIFPLITHHAVMAWWVSTELESPLS